MEFVADVQQRELLKKHSIGQMPHVICDPDVVPPWRKTSDGLLSREDGLCE